MSPIGIFGGTFDPIHYGHLRTALELLQGLDLSEIRFMPCGDPPHRLRPTAPSDLRLRMVEAAIKGYQEFLVDDRELKRDGPSYSVDTLRSLKSECLDGPLCLLVGMDSFLSLPEWHQWPKILELGHIVVAHRPGWRVPEAGKLGELMREWSTGRAEDLHEIGSGRIHVHAVTQLEISSTELRALIQAGFDPKYLVPDAVRAIIAETGCYGGDAKTKENG